ncbi:hypothetical protein [Natronococcus roseus]|uniref:hypothetical protein n=1 Tax=Natronococcus roseus TaxID=1052014 RepID=UPI00374DA88D
MVLNTVTSTASDVRTGISELDLAVRAGVIVAAVVAFPVVQYLAGNVADSDSAAITLLVGLPVIALALALLYVIVAGGYDLLADVAADR